MDYGAECYFLEGKDSLRRRDASELLWGRKEPKNKMSEKIAKAVESLTSETDKKKLHDWKLYAKD